MSRTRVRWSLVCAAFCGVLLSRPVEAQEPPSFVPECAPGDLSLDGVVVDRSTRVPLAGASVVLTTGTRTRRTVSSVEGQFRFCQLAAGERAEAGATFRAVTGETVAFVTAAENEPVLLDVDLGDPATVTVSVVDATTGDPVEGVTVRMGPGPIGGVTNADGGAGFGRVPPGDYRLRTDHVAYRTFDGAIFIASGVPRQLRVELSPRVIAMDTLRVRLEAGECSGPGITTLTGRVVDRRTGIPLEGAIVSASRFVDDDFEAERAQTDAEGGFFLCGVPIGARYRLAASLGELQSDGINVETGRSVGSIVLEIDHGLPAFISMHVTDATTGFPVEGAMIRLHPHPLGGITDAKGITGFRAIPPGDYDLRVEHIAYASFMGTMNVREQSHDEYSIELQPTAISVEPIEVTVTGRDPYLINNGFYDRMVGLEEGYFYDHWDMEPYGMLPTFLRFKGLLRPSSLTFVNGRPLDRSSQRLGEMKFREIRGAELIRCHNLPPEMMRYLDLFTIFAGECWATLIWRGEGRVRRQREKPTDRCANERRAELECQRERRAGDPPD